MTSTLRVIRNRRSAVPQARQRNSFWRFGFRIDGCRGRIHDLLCTATTRPLTRMICVITSKYHKGEKFRKHNHKTGKIEDVMVYENCYINWASLN